VLAEKAWRSVHEQPFLDLDTNRGKLFRAEQLHIAFEAEKRAQSYANDLLLTPRAYADALRV
jgi:hypothetical protein